MKIKKKYSVKEIFLTLQGEGYNAGQTAIFCRFSGCNLWNGKKEEQIDAICNFCDTDFVGINGENGGKYSLDLLSNKIASLWPKNKNNKFVVFTGGEPLLQLDPPLIKKIKSKGFKIAIETNGTIRPPKEIDWICVSPKVNSKLLVTKGNEIKLIYPQNNLNLNNYEKLNFDHYYLQPLDNNSSVDNCKKVIKLVLNNPKWKLSIQTHKYLGIK